MFGIGGFELFIILVFGFLIFGPEKLPAMAKTLGKAIGKFRSAQEEMTKVIKTEVLDTSSDEPFKNPLDALSKVVEIGKGNKPTSAKSETFSERKARYDKERAAQRAAQAQGVEEGVQVEGEQVETSQVQSAGAEENAQAQSAQTTEPPTHISSPSSPVKVPSDANRLQDISDSEKTSESIPYKADEPDEQSTPSTTPQNDPNKSATSDVVKNHRRATAGSSSTKLPKETQKKKPSTHAADCAPKTDAEKAAARSAAAKKAAATRAANRRAAQEAAKAAMHTNEKGE